MRPQVPAAPSTQRAPRRDWVRSRRCLVMTWDRGIIHVPCAGGSRCTLQPWTVDVFRHCHCFFVFFFSLLLADEPIRTQGGDNLPSSGAGSVLDRVGDLVRITDTTWITSVLLLRLSHSQHPPLPPLKLCVIPALSTL